jgi:N-acetylneuraminic acid mutarotase
MHVPIKRPLRTRKGLIAALALAMVTFGLLTPGTAAAKPSPTKKNVAALCGVAAKGKASCFALRRTDLSASLGMHPNVTPAGYGPADLISAYNIPAAGGAGQTVALVDAFDDPNAEADLAVYRAQYGLPPCTTANGCFSKVDQRGGTSYPPTDAGWAGEISLDLDMVSAIAPQAHILLVESDDNNNDNLGAAVNEAVALGAKYVSNSYGSGYDSTPGSGEDPSEVTDLDPFYNHPGVAIVASSGDGDYGVSYPAASQYVTSVGGTSLVADGSARGWSESVWNNSFGGPGSGCSLFEAKPSWQTDSGCDNRTVADVSAVADPETGVSVYDTFGASGWQVYGGTSASSPIIAGTFADAGTPVDGTYPSSYPYAVPGSLNDVTAGNNGSCSPAYYCTAEAGYDGPTGLGTPNGLAAFTTGPHGTVTGTITNSVTSAGVPAAAVTVGDSTAITDASGNYSLPVPVGTYDVTAAAYGYVSQTVHGVTVTDGGSVNENFALAPAPTKTITGKVTDGSGHGWPLYAAITAQGVPGGPVYTNPYTGAYSLTLPSGTSYALHVTPVYGGYQSVVSTVALGSVDVTKDVAVPVDAASCTAAGYAVQVVGSSQTFDGGTTPAGWTVTNNTASGGWAFNDPGTRGNLTGGSGGFAIVDSDHIGINNTEDSFLTSPVTNLSSVATPDLGFDTDYHDLDSVAQVDLSIDNGATWSTVWDSSGTDFRGPAHVDVPIPQAANQAAVQIRFHYTGTWAWWWQVDNVFLGSRACQPVAGGLVAGTVADANTGAGVVGATVTSVSASSESATTVPTPDDPAVPDGFYHLFSALTGTRSFTASRSHYTSKTTSTTVTADKTKKLTFSLKAGRITVTPTSIAKTVTWGGTASQTVTLKNTGGTAATVTVGEVPGGSVLLKQGGASLQRIAGKYSPLSLHTAKAGLVKANGLAKPSTVPADAPWTSIADFPTPIQDQGMAAFDGKIYAGFGYTGSADSSALTVYDPDTGAWTPLASAADTREKPMFAFVNGKLYAAGGWGADGNPDPKLEIYDPDSNSWTTGAPDPDPMAGASSVVLNGKIYVIGGCTATACGVSDVTVYDPSTNSWSTAADYPEAVAWEACGAITGSIYCTGGVTDAATIVHTYAYDAGSDSWSALADLPADLWGSGVTAAEGQLLVSGGVVSNSSAVTNQGYAFDPTAGTWSALPNSNNAAYRGGSACGFYRVGGNPGGAFVPPIANSEVLPGEVDCDAAADVSWLSETPTTLTLAPGAYAHVTVTVNANVPEITQPGTYTAKVSIGTDTPYSIPGIGVAMTVKPPRTWGKISGLVSSGGVPIPGATVQITSWATHYTLKTDSSGHYALWLDVRNNPLQIICAKDGYQPQVKNVKITKGTTTTLNFTLLKD